MSEQGVPMDEVTATDHIQVRAKLVKRLKGANNALVWARIYYRADEKHRAATEKDGLWWWQASYAALAEETGLSEKQARDAVDDLLAGDFLDRRPGAGRAFMYRPITRDAYLPSGADSPIDVSALEGSSIRPGGQLDLPSGALTPSIRQEDVRDTSSSPVGAAMTEGKRFAEPLCNVLSAELLANGVKHTVSKSWLADARLLVDRDGRDPHEAKALIEWACHDSFWRSNILSMPTFRKQYDKLRLARERAGAKSGTVDAGRQADAILRAREGDRQAIAS